MKPRLSPQRIRALTRIEVLVIIAAVVILAALFLPALAAAKRKSSRINCVSCLKQIGVAFHIWEGDHDNKYPMSVSAANGGALELVVTGNVAACFQVMSNELATPRVLLCPEDGYHHWATNFFTLQNSNISYFIGLDADERNPQMILDGDDNLLVDGKPVQPGILTLTINSHIAWTKDRHKGYGNIGFADGHVDQVSNDGLNRLLGAATNRLVIP